MYNIGRRTSEIGGGRNAKSVGLTGGTDVRVATSPSILCPALQSHQTDQMASVCLAIHCKENLADSNSMASLVPVGYIQQQIRNGGKSNRRSRTTKDW